MSEKWQRRKILIWGKTRPEVSTKYRETVCTGGVWAENGRLVRIYPVPLRYMDDENIFKKYKWIEADVTKSTSDPRPESYKIRYDTVKTGDLILPGKGNWDERAKWIIRDENIAPSVEALKASQELDGTSLRLVKPLEVIKVFAEPIAQFDRERFWDRYNVAIH